ncbi:hypothetical protein Tco_1193363 [Tanacetum coccineum]
MLGPFEIIERVGPVAYRLKLPQELSCVHDTFHVSNLKKCLAEPDVQVPLDEIEIDENLRFVEEPIEIELNILGNMKTNSERISRNLFSEHRTSSKVARNWLEDKALSNGGRLVSVHLTLRAVRVVGNILFSDWGKNLVKRLKSSKDEIANDAGQKNGFLDPSKAEFERLSGQGEATNTNSTNRFNTVSSSINDVSSSFTTVDPRRERAQRNEFESMFGQDKDANGNSIYRMFTPVSAIRSSYDNLGGSIPVNAATLLNVDLPTDPLMPDLEDTADLQVTGIFNGAYDDEV